MGWLAETGLLLHPSQEAAVWSCAARPLPDSGYSFAKWDRTPPGTAGSACESQGVCSPSLCSPQCLAPGLAEPSRRGLICFSMLQSQEALSAPVQEVEQREVRLGLLGGCGHRGGLPGKDALCLQVWVEGARQTEGGGR